jgi:hypothetical protein
VIKIAKIIKPLVILTLITTLFIWFYYLYDVSFSLPWYYEVIKDSYSNIASMTNFQKPVDKVCKGLDGWLFYKKEISAFLLRWRFNINNVEKMCEIDKMFKERGIQVVFIPVPNKIDIYSEMYLPTNASEIIYRKRMQFINLFKNTQTIVLDLTFRAFKIPFLSI